jgi:ribonuclease P protein component
VAVVVPRFGETAVSRNRVKRRLRELVRRELLPVLAPQDVVVRATPMAYRVPFETLRRSMHTMASRLGAPA